jgi:hypothetical protein
MMLDGKTARAPSARGAPATIDVSSGASIRSDPLSASSPTV